MKQFNRTKNHVRKRICIAVLISVLIIAVGLVYFILSIPTVDQQLAAIDASHAVPDEDNAAILYSRLLQCDEISTVDLEVKLTSAMGEIIDPVSLRETRLLSRKFVELELPEGLLDSDVQDDTHLRPWTSAEYPELRQWLDKHQDRIDLLLKAAAKPACYFPLSSTSDCMGLFDVPLGVFRQHSFLLIRAANNDFGEGDIAAGLMKCQALVSMGRHLSGQLGEVHLSAGIAFEVLGLHRLNEFIMASTATDQDLDKLSNNSGDLDNHWESLSRDISRVRDIFSQTLKDNRSLKLRVRLWYSQKRYKYQEGPKDYLKKLYHRMLCDRCGHLLLIELRRFKNRTGRWPGSLDEIQSQVSSEVLIDPLNKGPFVYKLTDDGFVLYSAGQNKIDEGGINIPKGPDDWPIWPLQSYRKKTVQP